MKCRFPILILVACLGVMQTRPVTIWMAGDSTMSIKAVSAYPENGWGMPFALFWDSTVKVENRAMNGRSTGSFIQENRWNAIIDNAAPGDYVFIQFGHNDEVPTKKNYVPPAQFAANLEKFIAEVRARKATPILLTSVARRKFDSTGKVKATHAEYAAITRDVAKKTGVNFIDAGRLTADLIQQMGEKNSMHLFHHLKPGQHPNYPEGIIDDTHFSELGARRTAELILAEVRKQLPDLDRRIVKK